MSDVKKNVDGAASGKDLSKGERLRLAREALELEVSDVAAKLYFETRFILALENNDYSIFAGSAYLYGYMRAYVKLLDLPLDEFVGELKNIEDEKELQFESLGEDISYQTVAKTDYKKWILSGLLGLLLLVVAVVGYVLMSASDSAKAESITLLKQTDALPGQELRSIRVPLIEEDVQAEGKVVFNKSDDKLVAKTMTTPRLLLEYKTDSWTDIRDADGKRLIYRMVEKGNRLQLDSSPTYSILLGYSPGVKVSWNDQPFNLSEFERENIAYFVVGNKDMASSDPVTQE